MFKLSNYAQKHITGLPPLVAPTVQLIMATLVLVPAAVVTEQPYLLPVPSLTTVGALITLAVVCTALTFVIFLRLLDRTTPIHLTLVTYMVPIVGAGLGIAILGEKPELSGFLGYGLIIVSITVVESAFKPVLLRRRTRTTVSA